ncbi:MAG: alpha-amylase family glycosyl hydrolase [Dehalococcoidia bacterium]
MFTLAAGFVRTPPRPWSIRRCSAGPTPAGAASTQTAWYCTSLHVGAFTREGTFDGVAGELPRLRDLGVTAIELMPVAEFPGLRGWGYDGVSLFAPHHAYGGPDGLRRLVEAAHRIGLAVVLDVVYNHLGPDGNYLRAFSSHYFTHRHVTPWGDALNYDGQHSRGVRDYVAMNAVH